MALKLICGFFWAFIIEAVFETHAHHRAQTLLSHFRHARMDGPNTFGCDFIFRSFVRSFCLICPAHFPNTSFHHHRSGGSSRFFFFSSCVPSHISNSYPRVSIVCAICRCCVCVCLLTSKLWKIIVLQEILSVYSFSFHTLAILDTDTSTASRAQKIKNEMFNRSAKGKKLVRITE